MVPVAAAIRLGASPRLPVAGRPCASPRAGHSRLPAFAGPGRVDEAASRRGAGAPGDDAPDLTGRAILRAPAPAVLDAVSREVRSAAPLAGRAPRSIRGERSSERSRRSVRGARSSCLSPRSVRCLRSSGPPRVRSVAPPKERPPSRPGLGRRAPRSRSPSDVRLPRFSSARGARRGALSARRSAPCARGVPVPRVLRSFAAEASRVLCPSDGRGARRGVSSSRRSAVRRSAPRCSDARARGADCAVPLRGFALAPSRLFGAEPGAAGLAPERGAAAFCSGAGRSPSRVRGVLRAEGLLGRTGARLGDAGRGCLAVSLTRIKSHTAIARSSSVST